MQCNKQYNKVKALERKNTDRDEPPRANDGREILHMQVMKIGHSGIEVSRIALGTWAVGGGPWWGDGDDHESMEAIKAARSLGITLIDTAPVYGFGHSERVVGQAIKSFRDEVRISTKCGLVWDGREGSFQFEQEGNRVVRNLTPESVRAELSQSLQRLQTDFIHVYFTHWQSAPSFAVPIARTMDELTNLKVKGKIKSIGASNVTTDHIQEYMKYGHLDIIQEKYSILERRVEAELVPACKQYGISLQAYTPLEHGALTGKFSKSYVPEKSSYRRKLWAFQPHAWPCVVEMVEKWAVLCQKYACSPSQLAVAWLLAQGDFINVLCGARKRAHIEDAVGGKAVLLSAEDAALMRSWADEAISRSNS